jgi:hypothetical protein
VPLSITDLTSHLQKIMPKGYTVTTTPFTDWVTEAIQEAVYMAAPEFRERTFYDAIGDGVTTRYALPGYNVALLPFGQQTFPQTLNTAEVANPGSGPSLQLVAGGSTTPIGSTIYVGFEWVDGVGRTQLSPLTAIVTSAANQTVKATLPIAPLGVVSANVYASGAVLNAQYVSRVLAAVTVSQTATTLTTAFGLGDGATFPLVDYVDPTTISFIEAASVAQMEYGVAADGTLNAAAASTTALTLATALTSGQRLRIWYTRQPQVPTSNSAPIFGVPDDFLLTATAAFLHRYLSLNHDTGAKDMHWPAYVDLHQQALNMKQQTANRTTQPARSLEWGAQLR